MRVIKKNGLLLLLFFSVANIVNAQPAETIPEFTLFRHDKSSFTNKDLSSDKLLFFVFFDVRCEHCRHAIQEINSKYAELKNTNFHFITLDKPAEVDQFLNIYGKNLIGKSNVMLFFDLRNEFITKFKPRKYPSLFLYTPQRKLLIYEDNPEKLPKFFDQIIKRAKTK